MSALALYESMGSLSSRMVEAAQTGDWNRLVSLERDVAGLRDRLKVQSLVPTPLSAAERARKVELIKGILANDREVRSHTEPWMEAVGRFLATSRPGNPPRGVHARP